MEFKQIKKRITCLVTKLPKETDRSWLVSIYLSLKKAHGLNYQYDAITRLTKSDQDKILLKVNSLESRRSSKDEDDKNWVAGYFFNNAMFRMVALTEIGLKVLFEKRMKMQAPNDYWWLSNWYESAFKMKLNNIQNARRRVNKLKHKPRIGTRNKRFETMSQGIEAFKELLALLEQI